MDPMLLITVAALAFASSIALVAWRTVREERRRSAARVAALAAEIHGFGPDEGSLKLRTVAPNPPEVTNAVPPREAPRPRLAIVFGAAALAVILIAAVLVMGTAGADQVATRGRTAPAGPVSPRPSSASLELIALSHERQRDGLVVRGLVRNPDNTVAAPHLTAVVMVFNRAGAFVTSGGAEVSTGGLPAGADAPFVIAVPNAAEAARYRVSFRSDDRVVPHVDRRPS